MDREKVKELLESSILLHADCAAKELPELIDADTKYVLASNLIDIYKARTKLLASKSGAHAKQLLEATEEFVSNLKINQEAKVFCISTDTKKEPHYLVFITNKNVVVGCLKVVSQLNVNQQQWQDLWKKS